MQRGISLATMMLTSGAETHAMMTRAPSRPSTPGSCGFGLDARPFRFMNPSIPEGFGLFGTVVDLSAKDDHEPAPSRTTETPPPADSCLWTLPPLPVLTMW